MSVVCWYLTMKALLLSRSGDFGSLEDHWPHHPLTLPVLGLPLYQRFADYLGGLGIREIRILRAGSAILTPADLALEAQLKKNPGVTEWSLRAWPTDPYPAGRTLPDILREQRLFQDGEDVLVLSAPLLPLVQLTGPKVPAQFPLSTSRLLAPRLLSLKGVVSQTDPGPFASMTTPLEFYRTQLRLLATVPPASASLKGVHRQARMEAPLWLGSKVRIAAGAQVGPEVILAPGATIGKGARIKATVVLTKLVIGSGAEFEGKLMIGNTVIAPETGDSVLITDRNILRP